MDGVLDADDVVDQWTLVSRDWDLIANKSGVSRLGFALSLKFFEAEARFPTGQDCFDSRVIRFVAEQVAVDPVGISGFDWGGRTARYHRRQIRDHFGFREFTEADEKVATEWLEHEICPGEVSSEAIGEALLVWCRNQGLEPPGRADRIVGSARRGFDQRFCEDTVSMLPPDTIDALMALGAGADGVLSALKSDPGKVGLETVLVEIDKLTAVRSVGVPEDLFVDRSEKLVEAWRARAIRMYPSDFSDAQLPVRLTLLAVLCWTRSSEITDSLIDVLISLIHKINTRAERRVDKQLVADLRRVRGKDSLLFRVAEESLKRPDDKVREVVFPLVGERRLQDLVKEAKANEREFQAQVRTVLRGSYTNHYRRMMPSVLAALTFRSNNSTHRPVLDAIDLLGRYAVSGSKARFYDVGDDVPIDGVVPRAWREAVVDEQGRVERVPYELCVLVALKDGLRRREIFVEGANRWRNPEHDLPPEFDAAVTPTTLPSPNRWIRPSSSTTSRPGLRTRWNASTPDWQRDQRVG